MEQLSGLDGGFLAMETSSVYGHVGSVCIVDAKEPLGNESGVRSGGGPRFSRPAPNVSFGTGDPSGVA